MEDLVRNAKCGNENACSELFASVRADLIKVARKYLSSPYDCEDAVHNAIEIALTRIYRLKDDRYFKTWLTRIVINECLKMYATPSYKEIPLDELLCNYEIFDLVDDDIDFENMIAGLSDEDKRINILFHKYKFRIKEIAADMGMKEGTVKSRLKRDTEKLKNKAKHSTILLLLIVFITTSVIATCIISYVKGLFNTKRVGLDNDGVLNAIENLEWFQDVDMNYIDLGDGYKIKVDYLLMDEMNLYLIFDFVSEKDISKFDSIILSNLKITNENNDIIFDRKNIFSNQYGVYIGDKLIDNDSNHMKYLIYTYTEGFPRSKEINFTFSKITLAKKIENKIQIHSPTSFSVNLSDKFINRKYISYTCNNVKIKKAIITETGFYSIIELDDADNLNELYLTDCNNENYKCYYATLSLTNCNSRKYIIVSNFNDTQSDTLKLIINNNKYILHKD